MNYKLKKISGDASFREFYRVKKNNKTSIIVSAKREKFKNLIVYCVINNILNKNKIPSPKLIKNYFKYDLIEITDLGDKSFYTYIKNKKNKLHDYKKLIEIILKLQKIKLKKFYCFDKFKIKLTKYSLNHLHKESDLFFDWYLKFTIKNKNLSRIKKLFKRELDNIYKQLYFKNNYFTHKDFHASNIMLSNKKLCLIDSQDAIIGNPLYDVASLLDDVRIKLSKNLQKNLFNHYILKSKFKEKDKFNLKNDFDILSVQRNLKILGIFVRLHKRDQKSNYLKYLPYTLSLIERRMKNPIFNKLNILFKKYLPLKKLRRQKKIIKIGNKNLLERAIELLINHGVEEIAINVHHLANQIKDFINKKKYKVKIIISHEQDILLDTGGGILEATKTFTKPFVVVNPDTLWRDVYLSELKILEDLYFQRKKPCLLLVNKNLSFDDSFKGDFNLHDGMVRRDNSNELIFTGLQIIDQSVFSNIKDNIFSMNKIWDHLIKDNNLSGIESKQKFYHLNTKKMYDNISSSNIID